MIIRRRTTPAVPGPFRNTAERSGTPRNTMERRGGPTRMAPPDLRRPTRCPIALATTRWCPSPAQRGAAAARAALAASGRHVGDGRRLACSRSTAPRAARTRAFLGNALSCAESAASAPPAAPQSAGACSRGSGTPLLAGHGRLGLSHRPRCARDPYRSPLLYRTDQGRVCLAYAGLSRSRRSRLRSPIRHRRRTPLPIAATQVIILPPRKHESAQVIPARFLAPNLHASGPPLGRDDDRASVLL